LLTIGIVNNMPPAAIQSTERHFCNLLNVACRDIPFRLRWFRLTGARPSNYERMEDLWEGDVDGLIVTGVEPRTASLSDESFWDPLTRTVDWAGRHCSSAIWSCLGAHAAVLYLDGIERQPHQEKIFGIFASEKVAEHPMLAGTQSVWHVPHSRWNDLSEDDLKARGYKVLAKSRDAGVDLFIKTFKRSLFVFVQTHPEYDVDTLLREYRRDIARYQSASQNSYPKFPRNYFDRQITAELEAIQREAPDERKIKGLSVLERAELPAGWAQFAVQLYSNWIALLASPREEQGLLQAAS
jgi:homoserine O-succinyltransferase/O-acetyltransferase